MNRISVLIYRKVIGTITPEESAELETWASESARNRKFLAEVTSPDSLARWHERRRIINNIRPAMDMHMRIQALGQSRQRNRFSAVRIVAAVAVVILMAGLAYMLRPSADTVMLTPQSGQPQHAPLSSINEIRSGCTAAVLNTNSGVMLSLTDTTLSAQEIMPGSGKCPVDISDVEEVCLSVRRGGEFKITLEDSTVVWLNADSRLVYPSMFSAEERRVKVTGEAYFAVHPEKDRPFYVETGSQEIRVYGTTFNVRDYSDDTMSYTTLETGAVTVASLSGVNGQIQLVPGHQLAYEKSNDRYAMLVVDPQVVTSWRHGKFVFEEQPLSVIMRDLSRWYDFEYEFESSDIAEIVFLGTVPRYADFSTAVSVIEKCADLKFSVRDGKVYIQRR